MSVRRSTKHVLEVTNMSRWTDSFGNAILREYGPTSFPATNSEAYGYLNNAKLHLLNRGVSWGDDALQIIINAKHKLNESRAA